MAKGTINKRRSGSDAIFLSSSAFWVAGGGFLALLFCRPALAQGLRRTKAALIDFFCRVPAPLGRPLLRRR